MPSNERDEHPARDVNRFSFRRPPVWRQFVVWSKKCWWSNCGNESIFFAVFWGWYNMFLPPSKLWNILPTFLMCIKFPRVEPPRNANSNQALQFAYHNSKSREYPCCSRHCLWSREGSVIWINLCPREHRFTPSTLPSTRPPPRLPGGERCSY